MGAGPVGAVLDSALRRAVDALLRRQSASGEWEGEVAWGPMLAAQYVLMCKTTRSAIPPAGGNGLLAAPKDVGSGHAGPPFAACGRIGTASAVASIETGLPSHRVVAALPEQPIRVCSSLQDIVSRTSEQRIVAAIAVQLIATRTTANDVIAAEAKDRVVSGQAMDDIIARGPRTHR